MNEVRKVINNLLQHEVQTKARYLKQNYYLEISPNISQKKFKIFFRDYYKDLYTESSASNQEDIKIFLDSLDLPSIRTNQNELQK